MRNIVNDFCATLDNYLFPYQFTPRRGAPRRRRGRAGGRLRRRPVSIAESVPHTLGLADTDTLEPSNTTNTIDSNQRRLRRSNLQTAPAQTSGSARALPTHIASRPSGAYPFPYSFGDINQLPPVGQVNSDNSHRHEELCNHHDINGNTDHTNSDNVRSGAVEQTVRGDSHENLQSILPSLPTHIPISFSSGAVEQTSRGESHQHLVQRFLPPLPTHVHMIVTHVRPARCSGTDR